MKKSLFFISLFFCTTTIVVAQKKGPSIINPRDWPGWSTTTDGFPAKVSIGDVSESKAYVFASPVARDRVGIIRPYMFESPKMQAWIARGGQIVQITADIKRGPTDDITWAKIFINTPYAIPFSNDNTIINYYYTEPVIVTAYQICFEDPATGNQKIRYEIVIPSN